MRAITWSRSPLPTMATAPACLRAAPHPCQHRNYVPDDDDGALDFTATGLPGGAILTPNAAYGQAIINWTHAAGDVGRFTVLVSVADNGNGNSTAALSDQQPFTLVVRI